MGAACAVADIAKKMGIFTAVVVTSPLYFEEKPRFINAMNGICRFRQCMDSITIVSNDRALAEADWNTSVWGALEQADDMVCRMICDIDRLACGSGPLALMPEDVKWAMGGSRITYIDIGERKGEKKGRKGDCMKCWSDDSPDSGWRRGHHTVFCGWCKNI